MRSQWKQVGRREIFTARNEDEISVREDLVELPSGKRFGYVYAHSPYEVVFVVGINDEGCVLLLDQFRYLIGHSIIEVPAGSPEGDESLEEAALREFEEEAGYTASRIHKLASFYPSVGMTDQINHAFVAWGLAPTKQRLEESELIAVKAVPISQAVEMVYEGEVQNLASAHGILLAAKWWDAGRESSADQLTT